MKLSAIVFMAALLLAGCQDTRTRSSVPSDQAVTNPAAFNPAGAPIIALSIPNMYCESCVAKTTEVLSKQPGVVDVRVDLDAKRATVAVDQAKFDSGAALAVLDDYGFEGSKIMTDQ